MNEKALQRLEYDKIKEHVMEYAVSYLGKKQIEQMAPITVEKVVRKKLEETVEAKSLLQHGASVPIPSLDGIERILTLLGKGYVFDEKDFSYIYQFLTGCIQLRKYMAAKYETVPQICSYAASMYEMDKLKSEIERSIRHGQVLDTASKELLKIRKRIAVFEERLKKKLDSLMNKYRSILQENFISTRNGRYVLPIKKDQRKQLKGTVLDESASGQTVYMEPAEIANLQMELTGLKAEEAREEMRVLNELTALLEEFAQELQVNVETVGVYDFLFSKAKYAVAIEGVNVVLNDKGIIHLQEARHPLLGQKMVPLHFTIGDRYRSLIITGPNTGGKTLVLKTVGLLTVMVQSGLLVPVQEGSLFSIFSDVAVDIGDGQSIEHSLSTFSAHIQNVKDILQTAGRSTLVLIDEMASGTDPGEGVGLSIAILEELYRREATVVATTHFTEIKNFAAVRPGFENARMEFDTETLQPLYRLRIGEAGQSYAFLIALKLGIPQDIIHRSRQIVANGIPPSSTQENKWTEPEALLSNSRVTGQQPSEEQRAAMPPIQEKQNDSKSTKVTESTNTTQNTNATSSTNSAVPKAKSFRLGDRVYVSYLKRSGIVYETEDGKGNVGVLIQKQKVKINKKRLQLQLESKDLYPENYDLDIVFETKENRKAQKLMNRKHVEGLIIEKKSEG